MEEINRSGGNAGAVHGQMYNMSTLLRAGSPAQKRAYLPAIARGELRLQSMAVTEPTTGTDTTKLKTVAVRKGDRYVVNGQKVWTSRLQHSDLMILLARTTPLDQVKRKSDGLSVFIVDVAEAMARGMTVKPIRNMVNHETNEVFFDDLEISAENLIGEENNGFRIILEGLNAERVLIAAECVGDAYWFVDRAKRYASDRVVFDRPIGRNQGVAFPIAGHTCRPRPPTRSATAPRRFTMRASPMGRRPIWPRCCAPMHLGRPPTPACRPMAALASPPNMTSSANFVRRGSISCSDLDEPDPRLCIRACARNAEVLLMSGDNPRSTALDHLRVLDLSRVRAGPTCCRVLADFGADVIKIEAPDGVDPNEGMSGPRLWLRHAEPAPQQAVHDAEPQEARGAGGLLTAGGDRRRRRREFPTRREGSPRARFMPP